MHKNLTFNGTRKPWLYLLEGRSKSPFAPIRNNLIRVTGMPGAYVDRKEIDVLYINQPIGFIVKDDEHALEIKDELAEWLITEKAVSLKFDDEPGRTYYAEIDGTIEDFERFVDQRKGTLTFLLADPFGYSPEQSQELSDTSVIENKGTAPADPIFELVAKEKTTFAMVSNGNDEYNLIGEPADDDVQVVDEKVSVLYENGNTIEEWESASLDMVDERFVKKITGEMGTDGAGIRADGYGTHGNGLHGPAVFKEIDPIQDFEIETTFDIISRREIENFRMGILFHDENMNTIGHIGIKDNSRTYKRRVPLARYGPYRGGGRSNGNLIGDSQKNDSARNTTLFYLRAIRKGNKLTFYIGEWQNQKHVRSWQESYHDRNNDYNGKLKYVTLYISKWEDRPNPSRLRINSVELFELTQVTEDQTPYILRKGDTVTFDHKDDDILVNGESTKDLKVFGASFFKLPKGNSTLVVTPEDAFDATVKFRERFR